MSVMLIIEVPGFTQEQYDRVSKELHLPESLQFHATGPIEGGWQIVEVWSSMDAFEEFVHSHLMPTFAKHGVSGTPNVRVIPLHSIHK